MNTAAGLATTTIPTTVGAVVNQGNAAAMGAAAGAVRDGTTNSGGSWFTTPIGNHFK